MRHTTSNTTSRARATGGRLATVGLAAAIGGAMVGVGTPAHAATPAGIGTAGATTTLLDLKLGQLLGLKVLDDTARATTDPKVAATEAFSKLTKLQITSALPALNYASPPVEARLPGGQSSSTDALLDLGSLPAPLPTVVSGTLEPVNVNALLENSSTAASGVTSKITDLGLLSGLADVGVLSSTQKAGSGVSAAEVTRTMNVDAVTVLDLGSLLKALGIDVLQLPLSVISGLVTTLGLPVALPTGATDLTSAVTGITGAVTTLQAAVTAGTTTIDQTLSGTLSSLLPGVTLDPVVATGATVNGALDTVKTTLDGLLKTVLTQLDQATLLKVSALDLGAVAKAGDTLATSSATATGTIGAIQIGNLVTLPGLDLAATADQVNATVGSVNSALDGVLSPLGLQNILSVKLFDKTQGTSTADGYTKAVAGITGLSLTVTPPPALSTLTQLVGSTTNPLLGTLASGTADLPVVGANLAGLTTALGSNVLAGGLTLDVAKIVVQSEHATPATPTVVATPAVPGAPTTGTVTVGGATPTSLPRTGGDALPFGIAATALAGFAVFGRRLLRRSRSLG